MGVLLGVLSVLAGAWLVRHGASGWPKRLGPALVLFGLALAVALGPRGYLLSKSLGRMMMPLGLVWLGVFVAMAVTAWRRHRAAFGFAFVFVLLTAAGNEPLAHAAYAHLEGPHGWARPLRASGPPFDAVIVLGGGTADTQRGEPQLGGSGDRVMLGARLYHAGRTARLLTSGDPIAGLGTHDAGRATHAIWRSLQVPEDAIEIVPGARTTSEEARVHAARVREAGWRRVGLVSSAFHLPRALARFEEQGLHPTPLPADVRGARGQWRGFYDVIPVGSGASGLHQVAWEHLGRAMGR
ncbi:MAG: YdcF family protein [Sandaracinaceae bacterium]